MKYSTKEKWVNRIHRWTCKLFKYEQRYQPIYNVEKKIELIQGLYAFPPGTEQTIIKEQESYIKNQLAIQMANELIKTNAIRFEHDDVDRHPFPVMRATLNFVR